MLETNEVTDMPFSASDGPVGYDVAEVDRFRGAVLEALSARDEVINGLRAELAAARGAAEQGGSTAATRVLELATVSADQLVAEAGEQAEEMVVAARTRADELVAAAQQQRDALLAELADRRAELEARNDALAVQEAEHRARLREHFAEQLALLDEEPLEGSVEPEAAVGG
jgi:cell division septum initiation protein DivIVA